MANAFRLAYWLLPMRVLAAVALAVMAFIGSQEGWVQDPVPFWIIAFAVLAHSVAAALLARSGKTNAAKRAARLCFLQMLADVAALTAFLYFCGGAENPAMVFYLLPVALSGLLLKPRKCYWVAVAAMASFTCVAALQAFVPSLHYPLPIAFPGHHFIRWSYLGIVIGALAGGIGLTAYVATRMRSRLLEAEEQMVRSCEVFNAIISCMTEALVFVGPDGQVVLCNPALVRLFRTEPARPGQDAAREYVVPEAVQQYIERSRAGASPLPPETFAMEVPGDRDIPSRRFRVNVSSVFDETREHLGYVIVAEDITELWQLEQNLRARNQEILAMNEALRKNQREMAQREKMMAIGTMAAGVAHEIGNPLACLSAIIQMLNRSQASPEQKVHFQTLNEQVQRIVRILQQLVEFAKPATREFVLADLNDIIEETLDILRYSRRVRKVRIESVRNDTLPRVPVVRQQIQQVLLNLMLNALDAVEGLPGEHTIGIDRHSEDGWIHLRVRDTGCGMTEEQIRQAFEPFYTTKPPDKGTGLGLAVSYRLVEKHGGRITITSTPGHGTTVTVSLPIAPPVAPPSEDTQGPGNRRVAPESGA